MRFQQHQINVGGSFFYTSCSITQRLPIRKGELNTSRSILFFDRNSKYFIHVLDYLRFSEENDLDHYELPDDEESLRNLVKEAEYYEIDSLRDKTIKKLYTCWFPGSFLNYNQKIDLINLCGFSKTLKWRLIYKASIDGFAAHDFHSKCDGHEGTLTIIKTTNSFIFGGYAEEAWSSSDGYKTDDRAFIFSLVNREVPLKIPCSKNRCALYCHISCGPSFGDGCDIFTENNSNILPNSYANLGDSYKHPVYEFNSTEAKSFLAGTIEYRNSEIEVYSKY